MEPAVTHAIESQQALPAAPDVVARLMQITKNQEYRTSEVVQLITSDAGLATDVLRLANSALLGGGRKLTSISEAIVRLGANQVRTLVLGRGLIDAFQRTRVPDFDMSYFWRRSLATAALSARFAEAIGNIPTDMAFTCGLLADIGILVLARAMPDKYAPILSQYVPQHGDEMVVSETELLGGTHADISAMALEKWSLSEDVIQSVRYHHSVELPDVTPRVKHLAHILNGAGEIARFLSEARNKSIVRSMCLWAVETIGVRTNVLQSVLKKVESDINELAQALRVDIVSSKVFELLASAIAEQAEEVPA